jgi:cell division protein WhiA
LTERDLVSALWSELAAIEPTRRCDRVAERAGLGAAARGRARTPQIGRLAVRLDDGTGAAEEFDYDAAQVHCRIAHLRGLLLAHGSLSVTATGTHLELVVAADALDSMARRVAGLGYPAGTRVRRGRGVLTWKEAETIISLLRRLGASAAAIEIETRLLSRSLHGHMNRVVNAESANVRRAVDAAHRQLAAIEELERGDGLRKLSRRTRRVATARKRAPEATFGELAAAIGLSRGQVQRAFYELESAALHQDNAA